MVSKGLLQTSAFICSTFWCFPTSKSAFIPICLVADSKSEQNRCYQSICAREPDQDRITLRPLISVRT